MSTRYNEVNTTSTAGDSTSSTAAKQPPPAHELIHKVEDVVHLSLYPSLLGVIASNLRDMDYSKRIVTEFFSDVERKLYYEQHPVFHQWRHADQPLAPELVEMYKKGMLHAYGSWEVGAPVAEILLHPESGGNEIVGPTGAVSTSDRLGLHQWWNSDFLILALAGRMDLCDKMIEYREKALKTRKKRDLWLVQGSLDIDENSRKKTVRYLPLRESLVFDKPDHMLPVFVRVEDDMDAEQRVKIRNGAKGDKRWIKIGMDYLVDKIREFVDGEIAQNVCIKALETYLERAHKADLERPGEDVVPPGVASGEDEVVHDPEEL